MNYQPKPFFFYKNLTDDDNLKKISDDYKKNDGYTFVYHFNKKTNNIIISDNYNINRYKLEGKIVYFNMPNIRVIEKLGQIKDCHFGKTKYIMKSIIVKDCKNNDIDCFIIY